MCVNFLPLSKLTTHHIDVNKVLQDAFRSKFVDSELMLIAFFLGLIVICIVALQRSSKGKFVAKCGHKRHEEWTNDPTNQ